MQRPVRPDREAEPAQREIAAHHQRADDADQGAGENIGRVMRVHHHAAERDQAGIDQNFGAPAREQRAEGDQHRKGGGGMAGRQAGIGGGPFERAEQERIEVPADHRPRPPDHALDDGDEQAGHADRQEQEADAHHHRRQHGLRHPAQARRQRGERDEQQSERPEKPARLAEVGDFVERHDDPARQAADRAHDRRVEQQHAQQEHGKGDRRFDRERPQRRRDRDADGSCAGPRHHAQARPPHWPRSAAAASAPRHPDGGRWRPSWRRRRAEHRQGDRPSDADVEAFHALGERIVQPDGIGALHEIALAARVDQRETARPLVEELRGARAVGEARVGAEQEHQARLLIIAGRGDVRFVATARAQVIGDQRAREQRRQRREGDGIDRDGDRTPTPPCRAAASARRRRRRRATRRTGRRPPRRRRTARR